MPRVVSVSAATGTVTASPATIENNGVASSVVTVRVLNTDGNPFPNRTVVLSLVSGTGTLTQPASVTDQAGIAAGSVVSTTLGAMVIRATVLGTAITQTVTVTAAAAGLSWGFDPSGASLTNTVNRKFITKASSDSDRGTGSFPDKLGGSEGWDGVEWDDTNLTIASDVDAPLSPNGVLQIRYPVGLTPNTGPGVAQTLTFTSATMGTRTDKKMYLRGAFKLSADYTVGSVTNKMLFHRMTQLGSGGRGEPFLALNNNGSGGFKIGVNFQQTPDNGLGFFYATAASVGDTLAAGTWYRLETYLVLNSAFGVADGVFRCWINGTLVIERTNVEYLPSVTQEYWNVLHVSPTYGGSGVNNPAVFDLLYDQLDVWGAT